MHCANGRHVRILGSTVVREEIRLSLKIDYTPNVKRIVQVSRSEGNNARNAVGVPKQEAKLQRLLVSALSQEPLKRGLRRVICSEVDVSHGIADVVVATVGRNSATKVWLARPHLSHLNLTAAKLLSQLQCNAYRPLADIARSTGFSSYTVTNHLRTLEGLGLVRRKGSQARLMRSTKTSFLDLVAFEVKVSDWRHGLYQATHYRSFANRVALALPNAKARAVSAHKETFRRFGIGLAGVQSPASIKWYVRPARRQPSSVSRRLLGSVQILKRRESRALQAHGGW
jgi:DNA-binding Lrp family transcriptional regulator